jgi:hypothetical protein
VSVRRGEHGTIILAGTCTVEDAEPLLRMLQENSAVALDWTQCGFLHTAVLQVIFAARPALVGDCGDQWVRQWIQPPPTPTNPR